MPEATPAGHIDLQLPYGLAADGRLVPIAQVERGLACGCRCPRCDRRLVAKKGDIIRHHFAHEADFHCVGAFETMAHMLAKQIIADAGQILSPALTVHHGREWKEVIPATQLAISDVRLELWQEGMRPDIIARWGERDLAIEVCVTHPCQIEKLARFYSLGLPAFEIDVAEFRHGLPSEQAFTDALLSASQRHWLFHHQQSDEAARFVAEVEARQAEQERQRREQRERESQAALASAHATYERERAGFEREAIAALGPARAARWATEDRFVSIMVAPPIDVTGAYLDWRGVLEREEKRIIQDDQRKAAESEVATDLRARLAAAATQHFRSRERGDLWLRSTNPKLGRERPIDFCIDPRTYKECIDALR